MGLISIDLSLIIIFKHLLLILLLKSAILAIFIKRGFYCKGNYFEINSRFFNRNDEFY